MTSPMVDGDPGAPLLVVAMAPGARELQEGAPLVGPSGSLLWSAAENAGFSRADTYIVNTIGDVEALDNSPSPRQYLEWWDAFDAAIMASEARAVLLLGTAAIWRFAGMRISIQDWRGYLLRTWPMTIPKPVITEATFKSGKRKGQPKVTVGTVEAVLARPPFARVLVPTFHPSFVMRTGWKPTSAFFADVDRAWRAANGTLREQVSSTIGGVAFDIETAGSIDNLGGYVDRLGLADADGAISKRWDHTTKELGQRMLERGGPNIGHNIQFDIPRLRRAGLDVPEPWFDTMLAAQLLQPDLYKGLNAVSSLYLDVERWKHLAQVDEEKYNRLDAQRTWELAQVMTEEMKATGQWNVFQTEMGALPVLIDMHVQGLRIDKEKVRTLREQYKAELAEHQVEWNKRFPHISPASPMQLQRLFYGEKGYEPILSDDDKPTVDAAALRILEDRHEDPDISLLRLIKEKSKALSSYLTPYSSSLTTFIHPIYGPATKDSEGGIAGTGRPQASDPNVQQIPKSLRFIVIPHITGNVFIEFDFDQAELRVAAAIAMDPNLQTALDSGDVHSYHATLWGCSRSEAKTVTYCILYGGGPRKLQKTLAKWGLKRKLGECRALIDAFYRSNVGLARYRTEIVAAIQTDRELRNGFGRRRFFWAPSRDTPAALDFGPQSTVADVLWASLRPLRDALSIHNATLRAIVHDSFLVECKPELAPQVADAAMKVLTREFNEVAPGFRLPVKASKPGASWGGCY